MQVAPLNLNSGPSLLQSATLPEFQGYSGNGANVKKNAILFLKTRINHKESNKVSRGGGGGDEGNVLEAIICCCFCSSVSNRGTNFAVIRCTFNHPPSPRIHRSTLRAISEIVLRRPSLKFL